MSYLTYQFAVLNSVNNENDLIFNLHFDDKNKNKSKGLCNNDTTQVVFVIENFLFSHLCALDRDTSIF